MSTAGDPAGPPTGDAPVPPPRKPGTPHGDVPPWERGAELGWWAAFWRTVAEVMVRPTAFSRRRWRPRPADPILSPEGSAA